MRLQGFSPRGEVAKLLDTVRRGDSSSVFGVGMGERAFITNMFNRQTLYIASDYMSARKALKCFLSFTNNATFFPAKEDVLVHSPANRQTLGERAMALGLLQQQQPHVVVTTMEAVLQRAPEPRCFSGCIRTLVAGSKTNLDQLVQDLIVAGYERVSVPEGAGEFSLRGDILDIAESVGVGYRIEFFGNEIESIRELDLATNLSRRKLSSATIYPCTEVFATDAQLEEALSTARKKLKPTLSDELERELRLGRRKNLGVLLPLIPNQSYSIIDYLQEDAVIVFDEAKECADTMGFVYKEHCARLTSLLADGGALVQSQASLATPEEFTQKIKHYTSIAYHATLSQNRLFSPKALHTVPCGKIGRYQNQPLQLAEDVRGYVKSGCKVIVAVRDEDAQDRIGLALFDEGVLYSKTEEVGRGVYLLPVVVEESVVLPEEGLVIIGTYSVMSRVTERKIKASDVFSPEIGSYVVHTRHGIGVVESINKTSGIFGDQEYVVVRYAGGDKLHVPSIETHRLAKYSGADEVKLSKIGGADFQRAKDRATKSIKEMAFDLAKLYATREATRGEPLDIDDRLLADFCAKFPHTETEDQLRATSEILMDMRKGKIMDRLLCGDVGYGKTEVALRAAFAMITVGKQVAFLSPTTILTEQHYRTAKARMEPFGITLGVLSRFHSEKENKEVVQKLVRGDIDVVFGTHRMLSKDVDFMDLGLLVLDEEQRFGVEHKEKLKNLKSRVSVLTMTATPIPRTLHLSLSKIRDMSTLDTPPAERMPVRTVVTEYSDGLVQDAINREIARGGQVFVVYNRVQTIDQFAAQLKQVVPHARILVGHGQMEEKKLEDIIESFYKGEADVLISSTIIENGIDIARANTIIVVDSDRFGLSQLYQLRGRVGRSNRLAYAYFTYNADKVLTELAYKRLQAIAEFTEFGSGIKLAMRDLELRGAGNVLGSAQHGHMEKIGYDMYLKLLKDVVDGLTDQKPAKETKVIVQMEAVIPEQFMHKPAERMYLYQRIARIEKESERQRVVKELTDIHGRIPKPIINLTKLAVIRCLAEKIYADRVEISEKDCKIFFSNVADIEEDVYAALDSTEGCVIKMQTQPVIVFDERLSRDVLANVTEFLSKASGEAST